MYHDVRIWWKDVWRKLRMVESICNNGSISKEEVYFVRKLKYFLILKYLISEKCSIYIVLILNLTFNIFLYFDPILFSLYNNIL